MQAFPSCAPVVVLGSHCGASPGGLSYCGAWALEHMGSVAVAHGLSCPAACGIFLGQELNLRPLHWQVDSQPLDDQGSPLISF